jgi:hypothetical protein
MAGGVGSFGRLLEALRGPTPNPSLPTRGRRAHRLRRAITSFAALSMLAPMRFRGDEREYLLAGYNTRQALSSTCLALRIAVATAIVLLSHASSAAPVSNRKTVRKK